MATNIMNSQQVETPAVQNCEGFRLVANSIPQIVWMHVLETEIHSNVFYLNDRWYEYTGITRGAKELGQIKGQIHPDDMTSVDKCTQGAIKDGLAYEFEYRLRRWDGVYRWHLGKASPVRNSLGQITHWFGTGTDIHDRKNWAEELGIAQERLNLALDAGKIATFEYDAVNGRFYCSESFDTLLGCHDRKGPWSYRAFLGYVHAEDRVWVTGLTRDIFSAHEKEFVQDFRVVCSDSSVRWLSMRAKVLRSDCHRPSLVRGALSDISQLKEVEARLKKALVIRDEFLGIASHELKTPLTSLTIQIQMMLRMAKQDSSDLKSEGWARLLGGASRQTRVLSSLIEDLLDVSRISNQKLWLDIAETDLVQVTKNVIEDYAPQMVDGQCVLVSPDQLVGHWDKRRLQQILVNLLSNAIRYGGPSPILVRIGSNGQCAELVVQDQGGGIAKEDQDRVFDRFEQISDSSFKRGLGLGLYIVKQLVMAHGGSIRVESDIGKGSSFFIELPLFSTELPQSINDGA